MALQKETLYGEKFISLKNEMILVYVQCVYFIIIK